MEAVRQLLLASLGSRHSAEVITLDEDVSKWQRAWPQPLHFVPGSRTPYSYNPNFSSWLRTNHERFDAVVTHGIWKYHTVAVSQCLRDTQTPYFVVPHGMLNPWLKRTYPLKHVKKALFWHTLVRRAMTDAAAVLYLCEEERTLAQNTFDVRQCSPETVPLGICAPAKRVTGNNELVLNFPQLFGRRVLLFLGRICLMKGCDLLIRAFAKTAHIDPNCILVIAGPDEDSWQDDLVKLAASLGIENRIVWPGPLYGDSKHAAFDLADAFVLPSHCETFPVAVLEALAHGKPVLLTDKINIWHEIDRDGACLVGQDTGDGITQLLERWFQTPEQARNEYRSNAARCFSSRFEIGAAFQAHINIYQKYAARWKVAPGSGLVDEILAS